MSRIGKQPIPLADGIQFNIDEHSFITIKGKNGSDTLKVDPRIDIKEEEGQLLVTRNTDSKEDRSLHGLYRSLLSNMVHGVTEGYKKELEIRGVGFRASLNGKTLVLNLGFSHSIHFVPPDDINIEIDSKKRDFTTIIVQGVNKELVGQVAAKIRSLRPPEPYKGKGIRYVGEWVRRKVGKSVAKA